MVCPMLIQTCREGVVAITTEEIERILNHRLIGERYFFAARGALEDAVLVPVAAAAVEAMRGATFRLAAISV